MRRQRIDLPLLVRLDLKASLAHAVERPTDLERRRGKSLLYSLPSPFLSPRRFSFSLSSGGARSTVELSPDCFCSLRSSSSPFSLFS